MKRHLPALAGALALGIAIASCASSQRAGAPAPASASAPVTAYVVRHAEAGRDGTRDPALTAAGRARADALRDRLRRERITAIYASPYRRTRDTARPLAAALGIEVREYDPGDSRALARELALEHRGGRVLIVGHSNTVPLVVEALGGERPPDLAHEEHDALFIVRTAGAGVRATVTRLRYGARSDTTTAR